MRLAVSYATLPYAHIYMCTVDTLSKLALARSGLIQNINILLTRGALFTPVRARTHYAIKFFTHSRRTYFIRVIRR